MPKNAAVKAEASLHFRVSAGRVFTAWLDPDQIAQWFGPGLGEMVRVEVDARVGGAFSIVQRRGGVDIDHVGEYLAIVEPERLMFTWAVRQDGPSDSSRVLVEIDEHVHGCHVTVTHALADGWEDYVSATSHAWTRMLEAMADVVAG